MSKPYRRQIKTTLSAIDEKFFYAACKHLHCTEAQFVREAVLKKLGAFLSDEIIENEKKS